MNFSSNKIATLMVCIIDLQCYSVLVCFCLCVRICICVNVCAEVEVGRVPGFVITKSLIHATN